MTDEHETSERQLRSERRNGVGHIREIELPIRRVRTLAEAGQIEREHTPARTHRGDHMHPVLPTTPQPVYQYERCGGGRVPGVDVVDREAGSSDRDLSL